MRILIATRVNQSLPEVKARFNRDLFEKLVPPLMRLQVDRFDGCAPGDEVHLRLQFAGLFSARWISLVTAAASGPDFFEFVDEGRTLPPPLTSWKHLHRVETLPDGGCMIRDDITYGSGWKALDLLLRPAFLLMFMLRGPIYRRELERATEPGR